MIIGIQVKPMNQIRTIKSVIAAILRYIITISINTISNTKVPMPIRSLVSSMTSMARRPSSLDNYGTGKRRYPTPRMIRMSLRVRSPWVPKASHHRWAISTSVEWTGKRSSSVVQLLELVFSVSVPSPIRHRCIPIPVISNRIDPNGNKDLCTSNKDSPRR